MTEATTDEGAGQSKKSCQCECEGQWGKQSPCYTMSQLDAVMSKCKDPSQIIYGFDSAIYFMEKKFASTGEMSAINL